MTADQKDLLISVASLYVSLYIMLSLMGAYSP